MTHNHACRLCPEAHQLALRASALGVAGAPEVKRAEQGRLAGAVRAYEPGDSPRRHLDRDLGQRCEATETDGDAGGGHGGGGLGSALTRSGPEGGRHRAHETPSATRGVPSLEGITRA